MSTNNAVRISFRAGESAEGWTYITIENVQHVASQPPLLIITSAHDDAPEGVVHTFHEDVIAFYSEGPLDILKS